LEIVKKTNPLHSTLHPFDTADDFLDAIDPRSDLWADDPLGWAFRGQANAEWELRPRPARGERAFEEFGVPGSTSNWSDRRDLQDKVLEDFRAGLDRSGLVIPTEAPNVRSRQQYTSMAEPELQAFPMMALAQHYGLPTVFLDWTRRGRVAAYFAAVECADPKRRPKAEQLAVWALRRNGFPDGNIALFYEAPGSSNLNLAAQSGLFTVHSLPPAA
jgi:hypothetical protein